MGMSHQAWLRERLGEPACRIYIAEREGRPLGQIRFQQVGPAPGRTEVGVSVAAGSRREGWGAALIMAGVARLREEGFDDAVHAVKSFNVASAVWAFDTAGFMSQTGTTPTVLHLVACPGQAGRDA